MNGIDRLAYIKGLEIGYDALRPYNNDGEGPTSAGLSIALY